MNEQIDSMVHDAMQLNNDGVHRLEHHDYTGSIKSLSSALALAKQAIRGRASHPRKDSCTTYPMFVYSVLIQVGDAIGSHCSSAGEEEPIYVYQYARAIGNQNIDGSIENCNKISGLIVFNLALVHHMGAIHVHRRQDPNRAASLLAKAQRLYEHSFQIQVREDCYDMDTARALAIWNNLAHVSCLLNEEVKAQKCWKRLLALILYLRDSPHTDNCSLSAEPFISNVLHLILKSPNSSAAA